jgi:hypothetical protein
MLPTKPKATTQNTAQNARNKEVIGIVPPVLMKATRPLVGSTMRPDWDAIAAFVAGRTGAVALNT